MQHALLSKYTKVVLSSLFRSSARSKIIECPPPAFLPSSSYLLCYHHSTKISTRSGSSAYSGSGSRGQFVVEQAQTICASAGGIPQAQFNKNRVCFLTSFSDINSKMFGRRYFGEYTICSMLYAQSYFTTFYINLLHGVFF